MMRWFPLGTRKYKHLTAQVLAALLKESSLDTPHVRTLAMATTVGR